MLLVVVVEEVDPLASWMSKAIYTLLDGLLARLPYRLFGPWADGPHAEGF